MRQNNHKMARVTRWGTSAILLLGFAGCSSMDSGSTQSGVSKTPAATQTSMGTPKDGELPYPAGYMAWPKFLTDLHKPDAKQVRNLYVNSTGAMTKEGEAFPNGTVMVMELYKAQMDGGALITRSDGKLVKGDLAKIFVMAKGDGWGQDVPDHLKNGSWVYSAFGPDRKPLMEDFGKCRACHAPLGQQKDFVHKYDEYFAKRAHM